MSDDDFGPPKPVENVPASLWKTVDANDIAKWNWRSGWFLSRGYTGKNGSYEEVRFNETELNALLDKRRELISGEGPRARKKREALRDPSWEDWVAAIAILATEQKIHGHMTPAALLGIIESRLQKWGIEPKDPRTVRPTISAIISRFRSDPPKP
ncbi:MAG: hypothetical protein ACR2FK_08355 [Sphingomicrobium sp.]